MKFKAARDKFIPKLTKDQIVENRRTVCNSCPNMKKNLVADYCGICKCIIKIKTKLDKAKCPEGKW
jgi:hypothetical protein